jgi:hypothetical protein
MFFQIPLQSIIDQLTIFFIILFRLFTLQEMQDAIADTNNSAPGKDRLSYNMFKHLSENVGISFLLGA